MGETETAMLEAFWRLDWAIDGGFGKRSLFSAAITLDASRFPGELSLEDVLKSIELTKMTSNGKLIHATM